MGTEKGSCLCGKVSFTFELKEKHFDSCHCKMCRKWGGGPVLVAGPVKNLLFTGDENIKIFDSSEWAERGFCQNCGTNLFYRLKKHDFCNINLGTIDGHEDFEFTMQVYTDAKPKNYDFTNKTKMMTEDDVIKAFKVD